MAFLSKYFGVSCWRPLAGNFGERVCSTSVADNNVSQSRESIKSHHGHTHPRRFSFADVTCLTWETIEP
jgi:hypothetical protein